jgi:hypothetical protein
MNIRQSHPRVTYPTSTSISVRVRLPATIPAEIETVTANEVAVAAALTNAHNAHNVSMSPVVADPVRDGNIVIAAGLGGSAVIDPFLGLHVCIKASPTSTQRLLCHPHHQITVPTALIAIALRIVTQSLMIASFRLRSIQESVIVIIVDALNPEMHSAEPLKMTISEAIQNKAMQSPNFAEPVMILS